MAIPTTLPITLDDVIIEIYGSSQSKSLLADCFADANSSGFDATYVGSKDSLQNFRGYEHASLNLINIYSAPQLSPCTGNTGSQIYTQGTSIADAFANDYNIYSDASGTTKCPTLSYSDDSHQPFTYYQWSSSAGWSSTGTCT